MEIINAFPGYEYVDGKNIYRGERSARLEKAVMFMPNLVCMVT